MRAPVHCYGRAVLAPADGVVAAAKDTYVDTPIVEAGQADCSAPDVRGNYIILRHGQNEYDRLFGHSG